jgi:hypothetical protein
VAPVSVCQPRDDPAHLGRAEGVDEPDQGRGFAAADQLGKFLPGGWGLS